MKEHNSISFDICHSLYFSCKKCKIIVWWPVKAWTESFTSRRLICVDLPSPLTVLVFLFYGKINSGCDRKQLQSRNKWEHHGTLSIISHLHYANTPDCCSVYCHTVLKAQQSNGEVQAKVCNMTKWQRRWEVDSGTTAIFILWECMGHFMSDIDAIAEMSFKLSVWPLFILLTVFLMELVVS